MRDRAPVPVGTMPDGSPILEARLAGEGLEVAVLSLGAVIRRLDVHGRPVVLGRDDPHDQQRQPQHHRFHMVVRGAIIGDPHPPQDNSGRKPP